MKYFSYLMMFSSLSFATCNAMAEPRVIFQSDNTISIADYYRLFNTVDENQRFEDASELEKLLPVPPVPDTSHGIFPLSSPKLSLGVVPKTERYSPNLSAPIFIVGCDPVSLQWLQKNKAILTQNHAVGWVVEAPTAEAFAAVKKVVGDLLLFPVNGTAAMNQFQIAHYPVLISERWVEQ